MELTIRDVARATGVGEATLRAWERRYGFPRPERRPSGHRRYSVEDLDRIGQVVAHRERGLPLRAAIQRGLDESPGTHSIFARLRERRPDLPRVIVRKRHLIALTHAIEDESCARAERPLLIGSFQRERFYRQSEPRWRDLARGAAAAFAFADFPRLRRARGGPVEIPVEGSDPLAREWALVCHATDHGACLVAWEPPGQQAVADSERELELLLTVEPSVVHLAAGAAVQILQAVRPELAGRAREGLQTEPPPPTAAQLRLATGITARLLGRLA